MDLLDKLELLEKAVRGEIKYLEAKEMTEASINTICLCGSMLRNIRKLRELQNK